MTAKLDNAQLTVLEQLKAQPKRPIFIPKDQLNPKDLVAVVSINGVIYSIPRGVEYQVPEAVYDVWMNSYIQTEVALSKIQVQTSDSF